MHTQRVLSGIKPSGRLHLGNYIGAIKNWVEMQQDTYDNYFMIADEHALTVYQDPREFSKTTLDLSKVYIAAGLDYTKVTLFLQSAVAAHAQLTWLLNTITPIGWLNRMTQFKEKTGDSRESASVGLYDYPVLMAADILLYDTNLVPVGDDQKQHVELARDIAQKFNHTYQTVFTIPQPLIQKEGARIMSLSNPNKKMSKSITDPMGTIDLYDTKDQIKEKVEKAVTDSDRHISYDPSNRPGVSNLLVIYSQLSGQPIDTIVASYEGKGYKEFKAGLIDVIINTLSPLQEKYNELSKDDGAIRTILQEGSTKAANIANATLQKASEHMGIIS